MNNIDNFLSESYSEEIYNFTEEEYSEVMSASAVDYDGYEEWSAEVESAIVEGDVENFEIRGGKLHYKGEGQKRGPFVNGIEI